MCACPIGQDVPRTSLPPLDTQQRPRECKRYTNETKSYDEQRKNWSTVKVRSYNCESCLVPGRMAELLYTAKCRGADAVCLQGTQMTMETQWTHGQWYATPVARTTHRAADGVLIAVSMQRFSKESIVTHHVWHRGRLLGVRVKAGQGSAEVDTYFVCGRAPAEVSPAEVWEKCWDNVDRMLRSLPKRTRIIMAIDANATVTGSKETYPWIGRAGSAAKVKAKAGMRMAERCTAF